MDIRFLESLVAVIEHGSISAAARAQGLTSTAVSQRIRALEIEFKSDLLIRSGHSAKPSKRCLELYPRVQELIRESAMLTRDFGGSTLSGPFRIGAIETALSDYIPNVVKTISQQAPNCDLSIRPGTSMQLYEMLKAEQIDLAILVAPPFSIPKTFYVETLEEQPYVLVQSKELGDVSKDALKNKPIILYDRNSWGGAEAWKWLSKYGSPENVLCELDALQTITAMVKNGLGISLLPSWSELRNNTGISAIPPTPPIKHRQIIMLSQGMDKREPLLDLVRSLILNTF